MGQVQRINFLEGLRGLLAVWVMFCHVGYFVGFDSPGLESGWIADIVTFLDPTSNDAVHVFMALSGFVIFLLIDRGDEDLGPYVIRRFFRLWPVFIFCIGLGYFLNGTYIEIVGRNPWGSSEWLRNQYNISSAIEKLKLPYLVWDLPMLHGIVLPGWLPFAGSAFSSLAWCISTEWQFYLLAPFFVWLVSRRWGLALFAAGVGFLATRGAGLFSFAANPNHALLPLQMRWFFLGMMSYLVFRGVQRHGWARKYQLGVALIVGYVLIQRRGAGYAGIIWLGVFWLLLDLAATWRGRIAASIVLCLESRWVRYLGRISYPIYLVHWPVIIVLVKGLVFLGLATDRLVAYAILMVGVPAVTLIIAELVHWAIEVPGMEIGRKVAMRWRARGPVANPA